MAQAPEEIKTRIKKIYELYQKTNKAAGVDDVFDYYVETAFWQGVEDWTLYYMKGALCFDDKGKFTPNKIISLIQPKVVACGDMVNFSAGEVAQHIAKFLREQGGAQQADRRDIFRTPSAAHAIAEAEKARRAQGQLFKFGIDGLDNFGGVRGGQMLSIFGNPSSWKTALVTNGIRNWIANGGCKVLLFELDMGRDVMFDRLISSSLRVPLWRLKELQDTAVYAEEKRKLIEFCDGDRIDNSDAKFEIIDKYDANGEAWTLETVTEAIERKSPAVVCIDYLTLLKSEAVKNKPISDYEIANIAIDKLYDIAKTYGTIIVTLSQMSMESRRIQAQGGKGGTAKGGGKVEERSDAVIELFKDTDMDSSGNISSDIIATIRKARNNDEAVGNSYRLTHAYGRFNSMADRVALVKSKPQRLFETVRATWAGY